MALVWYGPCVQELIKLGHPGTRIVRFLGQYQITKTLKKNINKYHPLFISKYIIMSIANINYYKYHKVAGGVYHQLIIIS